MTRLACRRCRRRQKTTDLELPAYFHCRSPTEARTRYQCKDRADCDEAIATIAALMKGATK